MKNWNQSTLARHAKVALPTIANIETEKQKPSARTLSKIQNALEKSGIEFIDNDGVRKKKETIRVFRGQSEYIEYFDFVYEEALAHGGPIYLSNVEEVYYEKWYPGFYDSAYYHNMVKIRDKIGFKILVKEGNSYFPAAAYVKYRWIPAEQFSPIPFQVFGNYLAIKLLFLDEPLIFLIKSKKIADVYRESFVKQWSEAIIPPEMVASD